MAKPAPQQPAGPLPPGPRRARVILPAAGVPDQAAAARGGYTAVMDKHDLTLQHRLDSEVGVPYPRSGPPVALLYPSPYAAGMASLGFQWTAHLLAEAGYRVERAFLPESPDTPLVTMESRRPLASFPLIACSMGFELEIIPLVHTLLAAGIPPLRRDRGPQHPRLLLGGPITWANPRPLAALADALILGEADHSLVPAVAALLNESWRQVIPELPGGWVPSQASGTPPTGARCTLDAPAFSRLRSPESALPGMQVVEISRGCARACNHCPMRRHNNGGLRLYAQEAILARVGTDVQQVALVGAATCDHPALAHLLRTFIARGVAVAVSGVQADRLAVRPELMPLLRQAGQATLSLTLDGASEALRQRIACRVTPAHLRRCFHSAAELGMRPLELEVIIGFPGERVPDLQELVELVGELRAIHPLELVLSPFVPKPGTPLASAPFAGVPSLEGRYGFLLTQLEGQAPIRFTDPTSAWLEAVLARGGQQAGEAVVEAVSAGGALDDILGAFDARGLLG